ncbi:hypothetical protein DFR67_1421, partial [Williamsia limnetica]
TTPRIMDDRGKKSYQVWRPQPPIPRTMKKVTGWVMSYGDGGQVRVG